MLENEQIVVFGTDYGRHPDCTQHVVNVLAESNQILWINSVGKRSPRLSWYDLRRSLRKARDVLTQPTNTRPGFSVVSPPAIPLHGNRLCRLLNKRLVLSLVRRKMQSLRFRKPLVVVSVPTAIELAAETPHRGLIAYYVDDYCAMPDVDRALMQEMEWKLLNWSDVSFLTSERLCRDKQGVGGNLFHLPHGVEFSRFDRETPRIPSELRRIRGPIVGFVGIMDSRFDVELLAAAAELLPDHAFVLIGRTAIDPGALARAPNVSFLGPRTYASLPDYLHGFSVGIIPYRIDNYTKYISPLKFFEYLACGMPVVATPIPDLVRYEGRLVYLGEGAKDFASAIRRAIQDDSARKRSERQKAAQENSWRVRAETFSQEVLRALRRRKAD